MSDSAHVSVVRRLYEARGNPDIIRQLLASDIRWDVTEGFPHSGVYVGVDSLLQDFFGPLFRDFETFRADGSEFFETGDHVIALGYYLARTKSGKQVTARFAHVWTLKEGRIVALRQTADTVQFTRALTG